LVNNDKFGNIDKVVAISQDCDPLFELLFYDN